MPTDLIRYDLLVQEALKGVVRRILTDATRDGLPGEHHFYISFRTEHPGVRLSQRLRERYPQDMTIVLQHQYDNLTVAETSFEVGLSFSGIAERLRVPFDSLTGFFDPSVQFGLKFETSEAAEEDGKTEAPEPAAPIPIAPAKTTVSPLKGAKPGPRKVEAPVGSGDKAKKPPAKDGEPSEPTPPATAEVVSLDSFRKKS